MPSIRKNLLQLIFSGASMKRWNDKLRPIELYEIDKQAHKMSVAWILYELNSRELSAEAKLDLGIAIVEGALFEYLYRLVITDIKPPVFYQIKANPEHYRRLTQWVLGQLSPRIMPLGDEFRARMEAYLAVPDRRDLAGRILHVAHIYASRYEFHLVRDLNPFDEEMGDIENDFTDTLVAHADLAGVPGLLKAGSPLDRFANLCGRLRFQTRWSQTPRIPETSVLGHLFIVAAFAYLFSLELGAGRARRLNTFFAGLFHDLPEVLTRDIISPVKRSVSGIADLIREYEGKALETKVFALLAGGGEPALAERLRYLLGLFTGSEFDPAVRVDGVVRKVAYADLAGALGTDAHDPIDGGLLKLCDSLAAFIEAYAALRNGISTDQLQQSIVRIRQTFQHEPLQNGIHIGALLADFD